MTEIVKIGQYSFELNFSDEAYNRRRDYFNNVGCDNIDDDKLTEPERDLLNALGIDRIMERSLHKFMPDFFQSLRICNTDTKLTLSKSCELPYYIIWSTLFANTKQTYERLEDIQKYQFDINSISRLIGDSIGDGYDASDSGIGGTDSLFKLMYIPNIYDKLFTLMYEDNRVYNNLFKLIYKPR